MFGFETPLQRQDEDPKNERSARQVALTAATKLLLDVWIDRSLISDRHAWLFPSESGTPIGRDNLWRRYMASEARTMGLSWATFQVMRRTFATGEAGRRGCSYALGADGQHSRCERE